MPIIGVTANISPADDSRRTFSKGTRLDLLQEHYFRWIVASGGTPILIPILDTPEQAQEIVSRLDGLVVSGGVDVEPTLYHEANTHSLGCQIERDRFEIALVNSARKEAKAVLGICRGIQVINTVFGGSLYQDVPTMIEAPLQHHDWENLKDAYHPILFTRNSPLSNLFDTPEITVNSSHHQSLKGIGKGLETLAAAHDGVIEAVTCPADRFTYGVQWHPERMLNDPKQIELGKWFVANAV